MVAKFRDHNGDGDGEQQKNNFARESRFYVHTWAVVYTTATWNFLISRARFISLLAEVSHDEVKMRERRETLLSLIFASSLETSASREPVYGVGEHNTKIFFFFFYT